MLLLVKIRNAGELLWDSLDTQERMFLLYLVGSVVLSLMVSGQKKRREQLKDEIVTELMERSHGR